MLFQSARVWLSLARIGSRDNTWLRCPVSAWPGLSPAASGVRRGCNRCARATGPEGGGGSRQGKRGRGHGRPGEGATIAGQAQPTGALSRSKELERAYCVCAGELSLFFHPEPFFGLPCRPLLPPIEVSPGEPPWRASAPSCHGPSCHRGHVCRCVGLFTASAAAGHQPSGLAQHGFTSSRFRRSEGQGGSCWASVEAWAALCSFRRRRGVLWGSFLAGARVPWPGALSSTFRGSPFRPLLLSLHLHSLADLLPPSYRDPCGHTATLVIRDSLPTSGSLSLHEVTFPGPREEGWTSWREAITLHAAAPLVHFLQTSLTSDLGLPWKPDATCLPR